MGDYHVYLVDLVPDGMRRLAHFTQASKDHVTGYMAQVYAQVCQGTQDVPVVTWGPGIPQEGEVVVYFVTDRPASVIAQLGGAAGQDAGKTATTREGVVSEVYVARASPAGAIARTAFHELMHNKLECSQHPALHDLHTEGGAGLASARVAHNTPATPRNIELMREALRTPVPQYTGRMRTPPAAGVDAGVDAGVGAGT